jgi:VCBS repeat-containing protein
MPAQNLVTESNTQAASTISGTLNNGVLQGLQVTGVFLAGQLAGQVGTQVAGIFGWLNVLSDGSYSYTLNNLDPDTDILAAGEQAFDRFVVTYSIGGQTRAVAVDITINGIDDPGQINLITDTTRIFSADGEIAAGTRLISTAARAVFEDWQATGPIHVINRGSITLLGNGGFLATACRCRVLTDCLTTSGG